MKKITRFFFLSAIVVASVNVANAQATIDFETVGNAWTWLAFQNSPETAGFSLVANPSAAGINTSANVAKFVVDPAGKAWAGVLSTSIGSLTLSATNSKVKIVVYKDHVSNFLLKFESLETIPVTVFELKVANTVINQWEELTFDLSAHIGSTVGRIVFIPDFSADPRPYGSTNYWDNISFNSTTQGDAAPIIAATTPSLPSNKVISIFSNAYTNVAVDTYCTVWSHATCTSVQIAGNDTKKYNTLEYAGIETTGANLINATSMTHIHFDAWTPDANNIGIKLVDFGANAAYGGGDDVEFQKDNTPILSEWNSYNIALSDFTGLTSRSHLAQIVLMGASKLVYFDNIYLYDGTTTSNSMIYNNGKVKLFPNPIKEKLFINSSIEMIQVEVRNLLGQVVKVEKVTGFEKSIDLNGLSAGNYFITTQLSNGTASKQKIVKL
ncbi:MAG: T9SS type A sorting domain-containing protein [Bacteroidales bacterium]